MPISKPQSLLILGSTGTIGVNTLDVVARHPDRFKVFGLVAAKNIDLLQDQIECHCPEIALICDHEAFSKWMRENRSETLRQKLGYAPQVLGFDALSDLCKASKVDVVVAAIVGSAGLQPALDSLQAGKKVLLANKESLVLAGRFMIEACKRSGASILPVDSEHNAIYQCLPANYDLNRAHEYGIERLILTASGGPFRNTSPSDLKNVTPAQAIAHPNWVMGRKISVDSATMANKGLELIEALWMFGLPHSRLSVLIHPQSIVHSLVEYLDGSMLAQLGCPDMRTPIAHVLGLPDRIQSGSPRLNLAQLKQLDFEEPDLERFPMLSLSFGVLEKPETLAPVLNAANEVAVELFLNEKLGFMDIYSLVSHCLNRFGSDTVSTLQEVLDLDERVRSFALESLVFFSK